MEKEQNAEQAVTRPAPEGGDKTETVSYGKFRTSDELLNAYNSLEAEFTRRSQRIKELEGKLESGLIEEEWSKRLEELHKKYPVSRKLNKELGEYLKANESLIGEKDCLEKALLNVLAVKSEFSSDPEKTVKSPNPIPAPETDPERERERFAPPEAPPRIMTVSGNTPAGTFRKPASVAEAGRLAAEHFKKIKGV